MAFYSDPVIQQQGALSKRLFGPDTQALLPVAESKGAFSEEPELLIEVGAGELHRMTVLDATEQPLDLDLNEVAESGASLEDMERLELITARLADMRVRLFTAIVLVESAYDLNVALATIAEFDEAKDSRRSRVMFTTVLPHNVWDIDRRPVAASGDARVDVFDTGYGAIHVNVEPYLFVSDDGRSARTLWEIIRCVFDSVWTSGMMTWCIANLTACVTPEPIPSLVGCPLAYPTCCEAFLSLNELAFGDSCRFDSPSPSDLWKTLVHIVDKLCIFS
ncbi:MAG: hypothetical protein Tsb0013_00470 [Phycisphaerales bacterium]